ncbi:isoaspartyl peptidase/L-asparaginase-like [Gigantopelta aegis]|uniref:isoaspartyl peptidase/L-asparaginase-like n=1 Tax=Gigantopelta aegis TaxID=1735272 RepID=UPI001B88C417|nr:isoaspartyl peptidase/L-asparaginase-like [Gigantopelta aegis]XP_041350654.1 isoaspartyl peptidase/L-asparaginase-like [Gigantopelta aegis]XP_041350656.1 isoaspartyl peptidase/L-asparaginase-like [Gigantopelta aegis]
MCDTTPVMIVHGGAWAIPDDLAEASVNGVKKAVCAGYQVLLQGAAAVDAVEAAVCMLEDDPAFDAGTGSVLNFDGEVEMDAVIMDGHDLRAGAVACVQNIAHPVKLARMVMDKTDHVLIVGKGANQFAKEMRVETVPTEKLVTEEAVRELEYYRKYKSTVNSLFKTRDDVLGHDTVGAVALDCMGNLAFATSTGGISAKRPGRVGDAPIIGCGGYADSKVGGVSTTGHGEAIMKICLAKNIIHFMEQGLSPQEASESALRSMAERVSGSGGVITISNHGNVGKHFTTERMAWAWLKEGQMHYGLNPGEDFVTQYSVQ